LVVLHGVCAGLHGGGSEAAVGVCVSPVLRVVVEPKSRSVS
jgi:hypothetical protein